MIGIIRILTISFIFFILTANIYSLPWPVFPDSTGREIGNSYGQFQCYYGDNCTPYAHSGIDVMVPPGTPIYAVKAGYVKAILTTGAPTHWRVVIGDSAGTGECEAWMYAHVDQGSIISAGLSVGDYVEAGQYIGYVVPFSTEEFHHLHFSIIRYAGTDEDWAEWGNWPFVGDPLDYLDPDSDPDPPVILNAYGDQLLAFSLNEVASYFSEGAVLGGDVDIICHVYDYINCYDYKVAPWGLEYKIEGDSSIPWTNSICFSTELGPYSEIYNEILVYHQDDATCNSRGDYNDREYYFNLTSNNGDSVIEYADSYYCWHTAVFHNGDYKISVRAYDHAGNETIDSMTVTISNSFILSGTVTLEGDPGDLSGTVVRVEPSGEADTTDYEGDYYFPGIDGGSQRLICEHTGYSAADTVLMMNRAWQIDMALEYAPYICGDADGSGAINLLDITFLITYLYKSGPAPSPPEAGDADNSGALNLLDVTYLINYLYKDGPEPSC